MIALDVQGISKSFNNVQSAAVDRVSFQLEDGEILALVGPSGCGKTTTLRMIAGLERLDSGSISINGNLVASETSFTPPEKRGVGMVFQDHALFPHLTVFENVAFGLQGLRKNEKAQIVQEILALVGLVSLSNRYPHALSGGERQRVALARALAPKPILVLMDEPFSSLDAEMRLEVREHVRSILKSMHTTVVFVTHDQEEALFMGDRVAVFQYGHLEQMGTPEQVFHQAATRFVAEFMGGTDFLQGTATPDGIQTEIGFLRQNCPKSVSGHVEIALRADDVNFQLDDAGNSVVSERFFRGAFNVYRLRLDSGQVLHAIKDHTEFLPVGARVNTWISARHPLTVFPVPVKA